MRSGNVMIQVKQANEGDVAFINSKQIFIIKEIKFYQYLGYMPGSRLDLNNSNKEFTDFVCSFDQGYSIGYSANILNPTDEQIDAILNKIAEIEEVSADELNDIKAEIRKAQNAPMPKNHELTMAMAQGLLSVAALKSNSLFQSPSGENENVSDTAKQQKEYGSPSLSKSSSDSE